MSTVPEFEAKYLNDYLAMVEDTESPRLFHIWAAIESISMALGRRCFLPFGPMVIFPNQYVLLVGTPGVRKSTVGAIAKRLLKSSTGVRFAPADTGGARQGVITAMKAGDQPKEFLNDVQLNERDDSMAGLTIAEIAQVTNEPESEEAMTVAEADKHHISVVSGEFSRFIGQNNLQMLDFLTGMWDGEDYEYQLKNEQTVLKNPLINILGCTTPTQIANSMPPAAGGQGFLSRVILVYGARKYKIVPRPAAPPADLVENIKNHLNHVYHELSGPFEEAPDARAYSVSLYDFPLEITDSRFGYYNERRYTHLIKLAMCLAAARGDRVISKSDYEEGHRILRATERGMPDALGEFGMNPLAALKQSVVEFMRSTHAIPLDELRGHFHRDARSTEFMEVMNDLVKMGQLSLAQVKGTGKTIVSARIRKADTEDAMFKLLTA